MSTSSSGFQVVSDTSNTIDFLYKKAAELKKSVLEQIEKIEGTGLFAVSGSYSSYVPPGIVVDGVGSVRVPLSTHDALSLIQSSREAPFGKGNHTLVDETVRKTWEIDGSKVSFSNAAWSSWLEDVVKTVAQGLGVAGGPKSVRAELNNMLLYEEGAMFKAHEDTVKTPGMFGTLVICLPSQHTGGVVRLNHIEKEKLCVTAEKSEFNITYIAWYADVTHEIEPIQSGCRWVLTYNLVQTTSSIPQSAARHNMEVASLAETLSGWANTNSLLCLCYALSHKYTATALKLASLKGDDYVRARFVIDACGEAGEIVVLLASLEYVVTYDTEDERRTSGLWLKNIVDLEGHLLQQRLSIPKDFVLQDRLYKSRDPDGLSSDHYFGDKEHEVVEETFKDTAVLIVPKSRAPAILLGPHYSSHSLTEHLARLHVRFIQRNHDQTSRELIVQTCRLPLSDGDPQHCMEDEVLGPAALAAATIAERDLFRDIVHSTRNGFSTKTFSDLGKLTSFLTSDVRLEDLIEAFSRVSRFRAFSDCIRAFQVSCSKNNAKSINENHLQCLKSFTRDRISHAMMSISQVYPDDSGGLLLFVNEHDDEIFDNCIRPFIVRFMEDPYFSNGSTRDVVIYLRGTSAKQRIRVRLLPLVLDTVASHFELERWLWSDRRETDFSSFVVDRSDRSEAQDDARNVAALHQHLFRAHQSNARILLLKIQSQCELGHRGKLIWFAVAILKEMTPIIDQCPIEARQFYKSIMTTFVKKVVEQEPEKPTYWAQPHIAHEFVIYRCSSWPVCPSCKALEDFYRDSKEESHAFTAPLDPEHLQSRFSPHRIHLGHRSLDKSQDPHVLTVTKNCPKHLEWEDRVSKAQKALKKIPQDALKRCLGDDYDAIMNLDVVRLRVKSSTAPIVAEGEKAAPTVGKGKRAAASVNKKERSAKRR